MSVVAVSPLASVDVAEMESGIEPLKLAGGSRVRPESWSAVSVQVPSRLSVPALSVAPLGRPETVTARLSEPSVSASAAERSSAIALSSLPVALSASSEGASATAATVTEKLAVVVAASALLASVEVAEISRAIVPLKSAGGLRARPESWSAVSVQVPSRLSVPALSVAPFGRPEMVTARLSEPSVSASAADRSSAIALSSLPAALPALSEGASATAATMTEKLAVVATVSPLPISVEVAEMLSGMVPLKFAGGMRARPASWSAVRLQVPSRLSVPALRLAPPGKPAMVTMRLSEPSRSVRTAERSSATD